MYALLVTHLRFHGIYAQRLQGHREEQEAQARMATEFAKHKEVASATIMAMKLEADSLLDFLRLLGIEVGASYSIIV